MSNSIAKLESELQEVLRNCHDCDARPGQPHDPGCDTERCSFCGGQKMCCSCEEHDPEFARWTGIWPGLAETQSLGISLNAVQGHLAMLIYGKPGTRLAEPNVDLINELLPELRKVGHRVTEELSNRLHEGIPEIPEED